MTLYFADTSYYIALLLPQDLGHADAKRFAADPNVALITTDYVLLELSAFFAKPPLRAHVIAMIQGLPRYANITIVRGDPALFARGWATYAQHVDKNWSLVDCISFEVMRERKVVQALTSDRHFEQAGFHAMLKAVQP